MTDDEHDTTESLQEKYERVLLEKNILRYELDHAEEEILSLKRRIESLSRELSTSA